MTEHTSDQAPIKKLMMVDDNNIDQMIYKRIVGRSGLVDTLVQFTDPQEAIDYLMAPEQEMPSLVLLDINMPVLSGFDVLDAVSAKLDEAQCPVIVMLTTSLNPADERRARGYDVVRDFLNKPLSADMLAYLVKLISPVDDASVA